MQVMKSDRRILEDGIKEKETRQLVEPSVLKTHK